MRTVIYVVVAFLLAVGAPALTASANKAQDEPGKANPARVNGKRDWKNIETHLKQHQKFPASKADLVATCNNLADFSEADKKWFATALPEGTYNSPEEVVKALKQAEKMK